MHQRHPGVDYGSRARFGIASPQANTTVEPEIVRLLPDDVACYGVRLTSKAATTMERLVDYERRLVEFADQFDTMQLDALLFACTGSSYALTAAEEAALVAAAEHRLGCPVITAVAAIGEALAMLGVRRLAIVSPYPSPLKEASLAYWRGAGFDLAAVGTVDIGRTDTRGIYELTSAQAIAALDAFDPGDAQAILLSGTGMPTLQAIRHARRRTGLPVLSSNVCLVWSALRRIGALDDWGRADGYPLLNLL